MLKKRQHRTPGCWTFNKIKQNKKQPLLPSLYRCQKQIQDSIPVMYWPLTPCDVAQDVNPALQGSPRCWVTLSRAAQPSQTPCLRASRASFALTHTGNPWQAQELEPVYSGFSPNLCDLWCCCNVWADHPFWWWETAFVLHMHLTPKPHTLSSNHFNTTSQLFLYAQLIYFLLLLCHVLCSVMSCSHCSISK